MILQFESFWNLTSPSLYPGFIFQSESTSNSNDSDNLDFRKGENFKKRVIHLKKDLSLKNPAEANCMEKDLEYEQSEFFVFKHMYKNMRSILILWDANKVTKMDQKLLA